MNGTEWAKFVAKARNDALAMAVNAPPLEFGQYVAWTEHQLGCTNGLSVKHLAANDKVTLCGKIMPSRIRRLTVVPKTLHVCGQCSVKYVKICEAETAPPASRTTVAIGG